MTQRVETEHYGIGDLSFDNLLSTSKLLKGGKMYGKHCSVMEIHTGSDRDIFAETLRIGTNMFVVCTDGLIELTCNSRSISLSANSMFLYNPGAILRVNAMTPSHLYIMIFDREFFEELGIRLDNMPLQYEILRERQTFSLSRNECRQLQALMAITAEFIGMDKMNSHYREMVKSAFRTFIYRALYIIYDKYDKSPSENLPTLVNSHFEKFIRLLEENFKKEYSIRFYSQRMNLTPKYLSLVIKRVSGKLATEWIDEYVMHEAKNLVRYSSMSIQEIAYTLNFRNQSFFGKYFKRHTGLSPKAYRQNT